MSDNIRGNDKEWAEVNVDDGDGGPRRHPNFSKYLTKAVLFTTITLQLTCIYVHSERVQVLESQLFSAESAYQQESEIRRAEKMAFNSAYAKLAAEFKALQEKLKKSGLAQTEVEDRLQEAFTLIRENLATIGQLTDDLGESTIVIDQLNQEVNKRTSALAALLQLLESKGIAVKFVDESEQPNFPAGEDNE